jgi:hypothetical protein
MSSRSGMACLKIRAIAAAPEGVRAGKTTRIMIGRSVEPSRDYPRGGFFVLAICLRRGFGSAPRHGRFGGSPEPETGESPAAAIFVFQFFGPGAGAQVSFASLPRRVRSVRAMHGIPVRPRSLAPVSRRVVQRRNRPLITVKLPVRLGPGQPNFAKRCGAEAARLAHNQKAMGSNPITATIRRDSKGSPCAPLKPATSGCDPWSRHHSRVSSNGRASVFQTDDARFESGYPLQSIGS